MGDSLAGAGPNQRAHAGLAGVVLAAGTGRRLRPLSAVRPKALCPVGNRPLLDLALERVAAVTPAIAVNIRHHRSLMEGHLAPRSDVHLSIEAARALGTSGAIGALRDWLAGRAVLVQNVDAWSSADLVGFAAGWDGVRPRVLVARGADPGTPFGPRVGLVASLLPWSEVSRLDPTPSGLYETVWRHAYREGRLDVVAHEGRFVDCGTLASYLRANWEAAEDSPSSTGSGSLVDPTASAPASSDHSVIGAGATVMGTVTRSVVWAGSRVEAGEHLVDTVRAGRLTLALR